MIDKGKAKEIIDDRFYNQLLEIKYDILLDKTIFGFFDRCLLVNEVLSKHNFFS